LYKKRVGVRAPFVCIHTHETTQPGLEMAGDFTFLKEIEAESGESVSACYQCLRCTNGCPAVPEMDLFPHQIIRHIVLEDRNRVLESSTLWACVQCSTCSVRCPNDIHIARVFEVLRRLAIREGKASSSNAWRFDELFLQSVKKHGRLYELETMLRYKIEKGGLIRETRMGAGMLLKRRMGVTPHNIRGRHHVKHIFDRIERGRQ
jgi:heterodisulfide reductase subunit C2